MTRVTDTLLRIARTATERRYEDAAVIIDELSKRHVATARELLTDSATGAYSLDWAEHSIEYQFGELSRMVRSVATLGELTPRSQDAIVSFGERLSSLIVAAALRPRGIQVELVDSRHSLSPIVNSLAPRPTRKRPGGARARCCSRSSSRNVCP